MSEIRTAGVKGKAFNLTIEAPNGFSQYIARDEDTDYCWVLTGTAAVLNFEEVLQALADVVAADERVGTVGISYRVSAAERGE